VSCNGIGGGVASCRGIGGGVASCRGIGGGIALHAAVLRIALLIVLRYFSACCSAACVTVASFALVPKKTSIATRCSGGFGGSQRCVW